MTGSVMHCYQHNIRCCIPFKTIMAVKLSAAILFLAKGQTSDLNDVCYFLSYLELLPHNL